MNYQALVLSHSCSGNTRMLADQAAAALRDIGWEVYGSSLADV